MSLTFFVSKPPPPQKKKVCFYESHWFCRTILTNWTTSAPKVIVYFSAPTIGKFIGRNSTKFFINSQIIINLLIADIRYIFFSRKSSTFSEQSWYILFQPQDTAACTNKTNMYLKRNFSSIYEVMPLFIDVINCTILYNKI